MAITAVKAPTHTHCTQAKKRIELPSDMVTCNIPTIFDSLQIPLDIKLLFLLPRIKLWRVMGQVIFLRYSGFFWTSNNHFQSLKTFYILSSEDHTLYQNLFSLVVIYMNVLNHVCWPDIVRLVTTLKECNK